ncbi:hypothetical protein [Methylocaldum sp.]|uniref:hypothetical protein n=1 Tax=Methylocaldum sp. TaxID=1969727 RepID=UPI002D44023F|nr:hypothetical protein [Methylocaldum sp.]HYE36764.1 hypothetical protein [Methylocaldum sp.]
MIKFHENFVTDANGKRKAVVIDIEEYQTILEELEELEAIRAYDAAKLSNDEEIPFEDAIAEIKKAH